MFSTLKVKDLKKLISEYRQYHNIKGYSKMKKIQLLDELEKRFIIKNNQLFLKPAEQQLKKRITPEIIGQLGSQQPQPQRAFQNIPQSNRMRRLVEKTNELEEYYRQRAQYDQYPNLAF
jgi:hypothetical protein